MRRSNWILYGAYGSTGRLILDEALRRGHRPLLAGRDRVQLSALGQATGRSTLHLPLDNGAALRAALSDVSAVLLAAGPYQLTGEPMRAACLDAGCSYLDVNGEIEDFGAALARSTGIPNIVAGVPMSRATAALMRIAGPLLGKLLTLQAATRASRTAEPGSSAAAPEGLHSRVWAEAGNAKGERVAATLETGEGYHAAAAAAVRALELQLQDPRVGALTPVQAFGASFALLVPGTRIQEL